MINDSEQEILLKMTDIKSFITVGKHLGGFLGTYNHSLLKQLPWQLVEGWERSYLLRVVAKGHHHPIRGDSDAFGMQS